MPTTKPIPSLPDEPAVDAPAPAAEAPADELAHAEHTNYRQAQADYRPINETPEE